MHFIKIYLLTRWSLWSDGFNRFQWQTDSLFVLCEHAEEVVVACDEVLDAVAGDVGLDPVHLDPRHSLDVTTLQDVGGERQSTVRLGRLPLDGDSRCSDVGWFQRTFWSTRYSCECEKQEIDDVVIFIRRKQKHNRNINIKCNCDGLLVLEDLLEHSVQL